jgi:hypothetical protein
MTEQQSESEPIKHVVRIPFMASHTIQQIIGDPNFIHIPHITCALPKDNPFHGQNTVPGYVLSSIPVYRTLAETAKKVIESGRDEFNLKLQSANFHFASGVSFEGDPSVILRSFVIPRERDSAELQSPDIEYETHMGVSGNVFTGYHDAWVGSGDIRTNIFRHKKVDDPTDSKAVVVATIGELPSSPDTIEKVLEEPLLTPITQEYNRFFAAVQSLAQTGEDGYSQAVVGATYAAMLPWYFSGMSAQIIMRGLKNPDSGAPYQQMFSVLREELGPSSISHGDLWDSFIKQYDVDGLEESIFCANLLHLGIISPVDIPLKAVPVYMKTSFNGFSRVEQAKGTSILDMTESKKGARTYTGFLGDVPIFQCGATFRNTSPERLFGR